jgi:hypothetical protein
MDRLLDGTFHEVEAEAAVVPFMIKEEQFNKVFVLVDGIYPLYSRLVRGIRVPTTGEEKKYTSWQEEGARKDWRGHTWQFLDRLILLHDLKDISNRVVSCLSHARGL